MLHDSLIALETAVRRQCHFCTMLSYYFEKERLLPKLLGSNSQAIWLEFSYEPSSTDSLQRQVSYRSFRLLIKFSSAVKDLDDMEEQNLEETTEQELFFYVMSPSGK